MYGLVARSDASYSVIVERDRVCRFIAELPGIEPSRNYDFECDSENSRLLIDIELVDEKGHLIGDRKDPSQKANRVSFEATGYPSDSEEESYLRIALEICSHLGWELYNTVLNKHIPKEYLDVDFQLRMLKEGNVDDRRGAALALGRGRRTEAVESLINALEDQDESVRYHSAEALGKLEDRRAIEPLIAALGDQDSGVRNRAALGLANIGTAAVNSLIVCLSDDNRSEVRRSAAVALGDMRCEPAVDALISCLGDADAGMRKDACWALGMIKAPRSVEPLIRLLRDEERSVKRAAIESLGWQGNSDAIQLLIAGLLEDGNANLYGDVLRHIGPQAAEALIQTFSDQSAPHSEAVARALGAMGEVAIDPLLYALSSDSVERRRCAAWALSYSDDELTVAPLIGALADADFHVRCFAASALGERYETRAIGALKQAISDEKNHDVRHIMIEALANIKHAAEDREAEGV